MKRPKTFHCTTFSVDEAAILLGVGATTIRREVQQSGTIAGVPVVRVGRRILVSRDGLRKAIAGERRVA